MAPEVGFEPTIRLRRINNRADSLTTPGPVRILALFLERELRGANRRFPSGPGSKGRETVCGTCQGVERIVVLLNSPRKIVGLADVQFAVRVTQHVDVPARGFRIHSANVIIEWPRVTATVGLADSVLPGDSIARFRSNVSLGTISWPQRPVVPHRLASYAAGGRVS